MDISKQKDAVLKMRLLKKLVITYLNDTMVDIVKQVVNFAPCFKRNNFYLCRFNLNYMYCKDVSPNLSQTIFEEPLLFKEVLRDVLHAMVTVFLKNEKIRVSQIIVSVVPTALPTVTECIVHSNGLCSFQGVLMEHTLPKKYTRGSVWDCETHSEEDPYFTDGRPGKIPVCTMCNKDLSENVQNRSTGTLVLAKFINEQSLRMNRISKIYESVTVQLIDVNGDLLELGAIYNITGIHAQDRFEAWNCEKYIPRPILIGGRDPVKALYTSLSHSPWMFTYALAMNIASHLYCPTSFIHLKLGLMLSLASHNPQSNFTAIPILAIGEDTLEAHQLMRCASRYARRGVPHAYDQPMVVQQRKDEWLEAGPLLLAQGGVCMLADWDKYSRAEKVRFNIRAAIETGNTNWDGSKVPLRSAVWAYWRRPGKPKEKAQLQDLIEVFGMPFLTGTQDNYEADVDFLFKKQTGLSESRKTTITDADMRMFLQTANGYDVALSSEAQELITDYFVASRRIRPACLPVRTVGYLTGLAEAHARLNFRRSALVEDVVAAIALYEESAQNVFGTSDFSTTPPPLKYLTDITQVDAEMKTFEIWLRDYISTARSMS